MLPSNTGMQRTALCARKIAAFLTVRTSLIPVPIYCCAAADAQPFGGASLPVSCYNADVILLLSHDQVLTAMSNDVPWFERIRKRPGMYVGPTNQFAVCRLIWDATDEAVDTAINGSCRRISVTIHPDCSLTIAYDGIYPETLAPDPRTALTDMATQYGWQPHWRLAPIPVINALAEHLTLDVFTGTHHLHQRFRGGQPISRVRSEEHTSELQS